MDSLEVLTWAIGLGFVGTWATMGIGFKIMFTQMNTIAGDVKDIDRRLCRLEGAMMNKECCILNHASKEKAE